jgi:hypothetical protein
MLQARTLGLALLVTAASANTLTDTDVQGFYAFDMKAGTMLQEIRDARTSSGLRVTAKPRQPTYIGGLGV